jgi:hypothetical protein
MSALRFCPPKDRFGSLNKQAWRTQRHLTIREWVGPSKDPEKLLTMPGVRTEEVLTCMEVADWKPTNILAVEASRQTLSNFTMHLQDPERWPSEKYRRDNGIFGVKTYGTWLSWACHRDLKHLYTPKQIPLNSLNAANLDFNVAVARPLITELRAFATSGVLKEAAVVCVTYFDNREHFSIDKTGEVIGTRNLFEDIGFEHNPLRLPNTIDRYSSKTLREDWLSLKPINRGRILMIEETLRGVKLNDQSRMINLYEPVGEIPRRDPETYKWFEQEVLKGWRAGGPYTNRVEEIDKGYYYKMGWVEFWIEKLKT